MHVGAVVLAGGRGRRMGVSKAWLPVGREFAVQRVARIAGEAAKPVVVAARGEQPLPPLPKDIEVVHDVVDGAGPLAGIAAGLGALRGRSEAALVVACDHLLLRREVVGRLMELMGDAPGVVVEHSDWTLPTIGIYRLSTNALAMAMMQDASDSHRVQDFAQRCGARVVDAATLRDIDPDLDSLANANDPGTYDDMLRRLARGRGGKCTLP